MWGVLSLVRRGMRRRRRRAARVVDESALGDGAAAAAAGDVAHAPAAPGVLARALLAMACGAVRLDGDGAEEAWAARGWRPARAADEVSHLMVRESLRYAIYA
ncbi:uncharacterized protein LOC133924404 [Phragmites australis]|uniref:uncharacterized protein LOC133924404 n=1 Tax=Phragmites australis TaxID=29695 RepID=UPI002D7A3F87|nr:uncharacterized protein LOC133924404 [Phragmites australis]